MHAPTITKQIKKTPCEFQTVSFCAFCVVAKNGFSVLRRFKICVCMAGWWKLLLLLLLLFFFFLRLLLLWLLRHAQHVCVCFICRENPKWDNSHFEMTQHAKTTSSNNVKCDKNNWKFETSVEIQTKTITFWEGHNAKTVFGNNP